MDRAAAGRPGDLPIGLALLDVFPSVVLLLAAGQGELDLHVPSLQVEAERDEGQPFFLDLAHQTPDLLASHQELPGAKGIRVEATGSEVRTDMAVVKEQLAPLEGRKAVPQIRPALTDGFHLAAQKGDPRLVRLFDVVVVACLAIRGQGAGTLRSFPLLRAL